MQHGTAGRQSGDGASGKDFDPDPDPDHGVLRTEYMLAYKVLLVVNYGDPA